MVTSFTLTIISYGTKRKLVSSIHVLWRDPEEDPNWNVEEDSKKDSDLEIEDPDNDLVLKVEENLEEDLDE
ncbi:hypothetical protein GOBAR_AA31608 [Gossypium barbadense]|uniref:Uncharacterized protein n=1 Tax=Gossypium barbadense TaxID=3634 RepID=A0A2P5WDB9_GOSBA|nr:hypothetical protein GOBAR_AA31608 [Gossypium barbadense]